MEVFNNVVLDIYDSAQYCTASDFNEHALNKLKKVIPFDSAVMADCSVTPNREFSIQALHLHAVSVEKLLERQKVVGLEKLNQDGSFSSRDAVMKKAYAQRGKSAITDITKMALDSDILAYCKKFETAHSLTFVSDATSPGTISTTSLWRATRKNAYQEKHGHAANLLLPHIFQARKINRRLAAISPAGLHDSSTALANLNGCLHFVEQKAIQLLQLEWAQWAPPLLPRQLIDSLRQQKEKVFIGASICVKASVQGNMICLVISARTNNKSNLTAAEYRAARLAVEGLQYKEIARQLDVSPATVRNQLHSAYTKLGVSNKTALAAALLS